MNKEGKPNGWFEAYVTDSLTKLHERLDRMTSRTEGSLEKVSEKLEHIEESHAVPCKMLLEVHTTVTQWDGALRVIRWVLAVVSAATVASIGYILNEILGG